MRLRIPPSPTGLLHIGTVRTALYNYLVAKKNNGTLVFRIEDTDKERGSAEFEKDIIDGLVKLGIAGDEGVHVGGKYGPYRQSERTEIYANYLKELIDTEKAYFCFCSKETLEQKREAQMQAKKPTRYDQTCRSLNADESKKRIENGESAVIRLKVNDDETIEWNDLVRGNIQIHSKELDDFVIARNLSDPLYHLTVVADDHDMEITHVIRGEDHISNTPKQILIFKAFGWNIPEFAHLPLILNDDKTKLSKRKNKVSVDDYLNDGILPEALLNFLALLGWNTADNQEIFSMDELIEKFSLDRVHKGGAVFDLKRLEWINGEWIKRKITENVYAFYETYHAFMPKNDPALVKQMLKDSDFEGRFKKLTDIQPELSVFFDPLPEYPKELIMREKFNITTEMLSKVLTAAKKVMESIDWQMGDRSKHQTLFDGLVGIVEQLGLKNGQVLWPIRVALSGRENSPNFATLAIYLGKEESIKRLKNALDQL
ncbi:glutamate--tRNA ligase [Candidatus Peregrinibacteria bacterium]|nr:MAG: glutamate--tRNA ligase [Candidatus Peregrinibacteria bacterium]